MRVDRFEVLALHFVAKNAAIRIESSGDLSDHVLHKPGVLVGVFGNPLLIRPLQHGVEIARGRCLDHLDNLFEPDVLVEAKLHRHDAALIVSPVLADLLAARAKGRDRHLYVNLEILLPVALGNEPTLVLHVALLASDGGLLGHEEREVDLDVRLFSVESLPEPLKKVREGADADNSLVLVEHLEEPGHVRTLKVVRQVDSEGEVCDGVLVLVFPVEHIDRVLDPPNADLVDGDVPLVGGVLNVH